MPSISLGRKKFKHNVRRTVLSTPRRVQKRGSRFIIVMAACVFPLPITASQTDTFKIISSFIHKMPKFLHNYKFRITNILNLLKSVDV